MDDGKIDLWVRQLTLMAVLLVALALIVIGVLLYAPRAHARHGDGRNPSEIEYRGGSAYPAAGHQGGHLQSRSGSTLSRTKNEK